MRRVSDLIDVWFDSGAMPFAQWGLDYDKMDAGDEKSLQYAFCIQLSGGLYMPKAWIRPVAGFIPSMRYQR